MKWPHVKKNLRSSSLSLLLHGLIILALLYHFSSHKTILIPGQLEAHIISATLYTPKSSAKENLTKLKQQPTSKIPAAQEHPSNNHTSPKLRKPAPQLNQHSDNLNQERAIAGDKVNELVALLHQAIAQHQIYPPIALQMGRQGRTTVTFKLFQDGHVSDVRIVKASGTPSLDHAALAAITDAAPFAPAQRYLSAPQTFTLDIVFEIP